MKESEGFVKEKILTEEFRVQKKHKLIYSKTQPISTEKAKPLTIPMKRRQRTIARQAERAIKYDSLYVVDDLFFKPSSPNTITDAKIFEHAKELKLQHEVLKDEDTRGDIRADVVEVEVEVDLHETPASPMLSSPRRTVTTTSSCSPPRSIKPSPGKSRSSFAVFDERTISALYAALYRNNRPRSTSMDTTDMDICDVEEEEPSVLDIALVPVEFGWFKKVFQPFLTSSKLRSIGNLGSVGSFVSSGALKLLAPPSFSSFGGVSVKPGAPPSFEFFGLAPPQLTPVPVMGAFGSSAELSVNTIQDLVHADFISEVIKQLYLHDRRVYCGYLELAKALYLSGPSSIRLLLAEAVGAVTADRFMLAEALSSSTEEFELSWTANCSDQLLTRRDNDHLLLDIIDFVVQTESATMSSMARTATNLLVIERMQTSLLDLLRRNTLVSPLYADKAREDNYCPVSSILKTLQRLFLLLKEAALFDLLRSFARQLILVWPKNNETAVRAFISSLELFLQSVEDPIAFCVSAGCKGESTIGSILLAPPVSAVHKCIQRVIDSVASPHLKTAVQSLVLLRTNNVLHGWILPFPTSSALRASSRMLEHEQLYRERRLERLVNALREGRGTHWSEEVRNICGLFLDDLLDHLLV